MDIVIRLRGVSPLLMHNPRMVDPEFEPNREIKTITSKRKKTDEDLRRIRELEWWGGLYAEGGRITQPTSKVRKCLIDTAKIWREGTRVERAFAVKSMHVPLVYPGPEDPKELFKDKEYHSYLSVGVNGSKRVMRTRPQFKHWALEVPALLIEDAGMNFDDLERVLDMAGQATGLGDGRKIGYGRFVGSVEAA